MTLIDTSNPTGECCCTTWVPRFNLRTECGFKGRCDRGDCRCTIKTVNDTTCIVIILRGTIDIRTQRCTGEPTFLHTLDQNAAGNLGIQDHIWVIDELRTITELLTCAQVVGLPGKLDKTTVWVWGRWGVGELDWGVREREGMRMWRLHQQMITTKWMW